MRRRAACAIAIGMVSPLALDGVRAQDAENHGFVTALDKDGAPIVGLTAEHFAIRESGRDRTVIN